MKSLRCELGFHDDATDAFGGYSPTCLRCDRPTTDGMTATARGSVTSAAGVLLIFLSLLQPVQIFSLVMGSLLFVLGVVVIWKQWP